MDWLFSLYVISSFFGIGVTLVDLLGLLGHHTDGAATSHTNAHADATGTATHLAAGHTDTGHAAAGHVDTGHAAVGHTGHGPAPEHTHDLTTHHDNSPQSTQHSQTEQHQAGSVVSHDRQTTEFNLLLRFLSYLRTLVYFAVGFGPLGWVAWILGQGAGQTAIQTALSTLCWSLPGGLLFAVGGKLLRRLQKQELDSSIKEDELLMEEAEVIVSINPGQLGKIRINYSGQYVERYAKASNPTVLYAKETKVRVVDITDEYLIVSDE